jgi:hypothetical protein
MQPTRDLASDSSWNDVSVLAVNWLVFDFELFKGDQFTPILHVSVASSTKEGGW